MTDRDEKVDVIVTPKDIITQEGLEDRTALLF